MDKLSALIAVMNDKFGANLDDSDKLLFEQTRIDVMNHDDLRVVALNNDRHQYRIVLEDNADDMMLDRGNRNNELRDRYFSNPEFKRLILDFLMGTYDEFRSTAH